MLGSDKSRLLGACALAGLLTLAPFARAADKTALPGSVAPWVATSKKVGAADASRHVTIAVHLALRDIDTLKAVVDKVSNPHSASYGHYLTPAAFRARFAPAAADVQAVVDLLTKAGMDAIKVGPAGAYVMADATVAQLESTFGVSQDVYQFRGLKLRANAEAPSVPAELAGKIVAIEGLDDSDYLRKPMHRSVVEGEHLPPAGFKPDATTITPPPVAANNPSPYCDTYFGDSKATLSTKPGPYPAKLPWLMCGYDPKQIGEAYGLNKVKLDGSGVSVAIIDAFASPTLQADGNAYAKNHKLPKLTAANFTQIIPKGIYGVDPNNSCGPYGWWSEQSLDLAAVHGTAPGASITYIGASDCGTSLSAALLNAIYNKQADVITNSYSYGGDSIALSTVQMQDQAFMAAASLGITLLFSSGDDGDLSQLNGVATASYESDSPYVTGAGGTSLGLMTKAGKKGEWGWGNYRDFLAGVTVNSATSITTSGLNTTSNFGYTYYDFAFYAGSGGGISLIEPQPSYQANVVPAALATTLNPASGNTIQLPTAQRVGPDISMVADPYTGYLYGETYTIAGNPISDSGCTPVTSTTEYCENSIGGTSLASPLLAGVMAIVDQARNAAGKPVVGFANPWLYSAPIGTTFTSAGVNDVVAPTTPVAVLRGYAANLSEARVVTISSVPFLITTAPFALEVCGLTLCQGIDDVFNVVTPGYDDVTGLGVPWVPALVNQ